MRLLLDEMYSLVIAEQLRARGRDVVSVNDRSQPQLRSRADADVFRAALAEGRTIITENVSDFRRLEAAAIAAGETAASLIFTTDRRFPRGSRATVGRLVLALDALMTSGREVSSPHFLEPLT